MIGGDETKSETPVLTTLLGFESIRDISRKKTLLKLSVIFIKTI